MRHTISSNKPEEIDKRSVGVSWKFRLLNWVLNTFYKDWTIVKDLVVYDNEIFVKNLAPAYGSLVILKSDTISIMGSREFDTYMKKFVEEKRMSVVTKSSK
jgi:hypothetical protein